MEKRLLFVEKKEENEPSFPSGGADDNSIEHLIRILKMLKRMEEMKQEGKQMEIINSI